MRKLFKKPLVLIITFVLIPFIIIGFLHLFNFLSTQFGINLNPTGIDNAVWFAFFGSFLGGLITLVAVWLTLQSNKEALEQSQRQTVYNANIQIINDEQKLLSEVIAELRPHSVVMYYSNFLSIAKTDPYNLSNATNILTKLNDYSMTMQAYYEKQEIQSDITNRCFSVCKEALNCEYIKTSKAYSELYYHFYKQIHDLTNRLTSLISDVNQSEFLKQYINYKREKSISPQFTVMAEDIELIRSREENRTTTLLLKDDIEKFTQDYQTILKHLKWLARDHIAKKRVIEKEKLNGSSLYLFCNRSNAEYYDRMKEIKESTLQEVNEILGRDKS